MKTYSRSAGLLWLLRLLSRLRLLRLRCPAGAGRAMLWAQSGRGDRPAGMENRSGRGAKSEPNKMCALTRYRLTFANLTQIRGHQKVLEHRCTRGHV